MRNLAVSFLELRENEVIVCLLLPISLSYLMREVLRQFLNGLRCLLIAQGIKHLHALLCKRRLAVALQPFSSKPCTVARFPRSVRTSLRTSHVIFVERPDATPNSSTCCRPLHD